jgi:orotidine-5'-phosphate decarboxylase
LKYYFKDFLDMKSAKDYIVFPLDVASYEEAEKYVKLLREHIGVFKVGLELFIRTGPQLIQFIKSESSAKIFLDLKLHDIPATVGRAMASIAALGVDFATVHCGENQEMLKAAADSAGKQVAVLGVTVLTSVAGEHIKLAGYKDVYANDVQQLVLKRAQMAKSCGLAGVICSGLEVADIKNRYGDAFLCMTPGIRPDWPDKKAGDQRRVTTPCEAIKKGADYLVIGRPIRDAGDPVAASLRITEEIENQLLK